MVSRDVQAGGGPYGRLVSNRKAMRSMNGSTMRAITGVLIALTGAVAAGCGAGDDGDKAGGSSAPTVLRLASANDADQADGPLARDFASRVAKLSGGSLRVRVTYDAAGQQHPDAEGRIARMVRDGKFDLGWIGARAWDSLGVTSLQALQAPFLVTNHVLLGQVATGPLGERMLAGLKSQGLRRARTRSRSPALLHGRATRARIA